MKINKNDSNYQIVKDIYDLTNKVNNQNNFNKKIQQSQKVCKWGLIFSTIAWISIMKLVKKLESKVIKLEKEHNMEE